VGDEITSAQNELVVIVCIESMADAQTTPDSAVSPTYSAGLDAFQTAAAARYDVVDVPSISLDASFYYPACQSVSNLLQTTSDVHYQHQSTRLHHATASKRPKYPLDDVASITNLHHHHHHHHHQQQSTQAWNSGTASHGSIATLQFCFTQSIKARTE